MIEFRIGERPNRAATGFKRTMVPICRQTVLAVLLTATTVAGVAVAQDSGGRGSGAGSAGERSNDGSSDDTTRRGRDGEGSEEGSRGRGRRGRGRGGDGSPRFRGDGERGPRPGGERTRRRDPNADSDDRQDRASQASTDSAQSGGMAAPGGGSASDEEKAGNWAVYLIKKHDKNGDMMLQAAEQGDLGQSAKADSNGDGVITKNELVAFSLGRSPASPAATSTSTGGAGSRTPPTSGFTPARGRSSRRSSSGSAESDETRVLKNDQRKSYRFTTPQDRLPSGLPSWFKSKDANEDGQVAMHEYSRSWSDRTAAEFVRYDKDNNGVITPEEAR